MSITAFGSWRILMPQSGTGRRVNTETDLEISEAISTYWVNFAKQGDPNDEGVLSRPAFSDANSIVMQLGQTPHTGSVPSAEALKALDAYFAWRRTPEGEAWVTQTNEAA